MKKKKRAKVKTVEFENLTPEEIELLEDENAEAPNEAESNYETLYKETLDRYQRSLAEFDNFRKRSIKEKAAQYDDGKRAAAELLLPVLDNFERAMGSSEKTHADDTFYQGISLIARQFTQVLSDMNVIEITTQPGDDFDTAIHYAVAHAEDDNFGTNQVAAVLQKGYMYKEKVLRYSMVKVAN
jgi:molecular chaperone GrpE